MHKSKKLLRRIVSGSTAFSLAALTMFGQLAPASAAAENHVYSTAQTAAAGEAAHIPILIENNTGFVSFNIYLSYDPDVVTPTSVSTEGSVLTSKGDVNDSIGGHLKNLPENTVQVTFTSSDYTNADADGLMFDFVCGISEEASGSTAIKLSYDPNPDITFNSDDEAVAMDCTDVELTITNEALDSLPSAALSAESSEAGGSLTLASAYTKKPESFGDMSFELSYDKWTFSAPEVAVGEGTVSDVKDEDGKLSFTIKGAEGKASQPFTVTFKVDQAAAEGSYAFKATGSVGETAFNLTGCKAEISSEIKGASPIISGPEGLSAKKGEELTVPVAIGRNTGLMGFITEFTFDDTVLEIMSAESTKLLPGSMNNNVGVEKGKFIVRWSNTENTDAEGDFITLKFNVIGETQADTVIGISYSAEDTFDEAYNDVALICKGITVALNVSDETTTTASSSASTETTTISAVTSETSTSSTTENTTASTSTETVTTTVSVTTASAASSEASTASSETTTVTTTITTTLATESSTTTSEITTTAATTTVTTATTVITSENTTSASTAVTTSESSTSSATTTVTETASTTASDTTTVSETTTVTATSTAAVTASVKISKLGNDGTHLAGAKLSLMGVKSDGSAVEFAPECIQVGDGQLINGVGSSLVWICGSEATIVFAEDGTYTLSELAAPVGYLTADNIVFVVSDGKVTVNGANAESVDMVDEAETTTTATTAVTSTRTTTSATASETTSASTSESTTTASSTVSEMTTSEVTTTRIEISTTESTTASVATTASTESTTTTSSETMTTIASETTTVSTAESTTASESTATSTETETTTASTSASTSESETTASAASATESANTTEGTSTSTETTASTTQTTAETSSETIATTTGTEPVTPDDDLGDVNEDGRVDAKDASCVLIAYAKLSTGEEDGLTEKQRRVADVNGDGKVDAKDASAILAFYSFLQTGGSGTMKEYMAK